MNKNVCIIHFNTPVLTAHLVKSINKHTPGTNIYIFDNSDKRPFVNYFNNVTVFDNTKGQIINFNEWLKKYPDRRKSGGKANNWGSAKHAYSVEKCMELINEPFVLFDSDVLVKKDFSPLFDEVVCYKGEVIFQPNSKVKRVLPFICFINTPMCRQKKVHYFDENYMHGLHVGTIGDRYDTGAAMYLLTEKNKAPHREIKVADYIVHYGNGSWVDAAEKMRKPKHMPAGDWLKKYRDFWETEGKNEIKTSFDTVFDHIYCLHDIPGDERMTKIKSEMKRVGIDDTAEYFSWVYNYQSPLLDLIYKDDRMNMDPVMKTPGREDVKKTAMRHYNVIKEAYSVGYDRVLIMEDTIKFHRDLDYIDRLLHDIPGSDVVMLDKMTCSAARDNIKYKEYVKGLPNEELYGDMKRSGVFFIFPTCYALNRNAMARIIELQEKGLIPADTPLNDKELTGSFAIENLAIRDDKLKEAESYVKIGLDTGKYGPEKPVEKPTAPAPKTVVKTIAQPAKVRPVVKPVANKPMKPEPEKKVEPKRAAVPDKAIRGHKKTVFPKMVGHNSLYDVY